jgi:glucose/arabinose dehydrogenase/cytochrome c553
LPASDAQGVRYSRAAEIGEEWMRRAGVVIGLLIVGGIAACHLLLPENLAIKGPILNSMLGRGIDAPSENVVESRFRVPEDFEVELFADGIQNARFMRFSPGGDLIVSQPRAGQLVHVYRDRDGDGRSDGRRILLGGLDRPHGFDFRDHQLFIGEGGAIARIDFTESGPDTITVVGSPVRIVEGIPSGENHWTRTLRFGPDGGLYLSVGSSCNVCEEPDPRRAAILRYEADGSGETIYASGLRNSVGFDWRPGTDELYATDNGRDLLGNDYPPCELNRIERGGFYGFPVANGDRRPDPDFGAGEEARIAASIPPAHSFRAHNAPLGITFVRHPDAPAWLQNAALVALHGSWNRTELDGYKVVSLHWDAQDRIEERDFLTGFEIDGDVIGRPVDVAEGPDGAIYVSDDYAGAIYRVTRKGSAASATRTADRAQSTGAASSALGRSEVVVDPLGKLDGAERTRLVAGGRALFAAHACGRCHEPGQVEAGVVVKPLAGLASKYTIDSLAAYFLAPQPPMPLIELTGADRRALAVMLLSEHGS